MSPHHRFLLVLCALLVGAGLTTGLTAGLTTGLTRPPAAHAASDGAGRLVLVLHSSGSMREATPGGERKIVAAKQALGRVIGSLPADQAVGLRVYGAKVFSRSDRGACTDSQLVVPVETGNRSRLRSAVASYKPYGETPIGYALKRAGHDLGSTGKRTIVLVSDGDPTCAPDPCQVARGLARAGVDLHVDVVGLDVSGPARSKLQCIARSGHGTYYDADSSAGLSTSLQRLATRAARPYATTGSPVSGSASASGAPGVSPGDYVDELGPEQSGTAVRTYQVRRTTPGDTLDVSATVKSPGGRNLDWVQLDVSTPGGDYCGSNGEVNQLAGGQLTTAAVEVGQVDPSGEPRSDDSCQDAHSLIAKVTRRKGLESTPLELRVREQRPARDVESLPSRADEATWHAPPRTTPAPVTGGSSFSDAPVLKPGTYRDTILPGEVLTYQVDATYGQQVEALATYPASGSRLGDAVGLQEMMTQVRVYDPTRAAASTTQLTGPAPSPAEFLSRDGVRVGATTFPIAYRNGDAYATQSGRYTVSVYLEDDPQHQSYAVPFTLRVAMVGAERGRPTFSTASRGESASPSPSASSPSASSPSASSPSASSPSASSSSSERARDRDQGGLSIGLVLGVVAVLVLLAATYLLLRLRRAR